MNFVLPGPNVKILARAVNCFSKIGHELFFEATPDGLELKTINATNTAYAVAQFKQDFFISFRQGDKDTPEENYCKISVKPILKIFKSLSTIQTCKIWLDVPQSKIIFQFRCKSEVLKTHKIFLLENENIKSLNLSQTFPSEIVGNHKVFFNILLHLHHSVDEITFDLNLDKTIVSNFVENEQSDRSTLRSTLAINTTAFQLYQLEQQTNLTLCYKEFKAATMFASLNRLNIQMNFSKPGAPLMLEISKSGVVQLKFIMGTMQPSTNLQSRRNNRRKVTTESSIANRSIQMDSEGINTCLTDDISHNTETFQNATTSARERNPNSSQPKLESIRNATDCNVAQSNALRTLPKPSSETMFTNNTEHFPFLDGLNLQPANVINVESLGSLPGASITRNATETHRPAEILATDLDSESCELIEQNSTSVISRKRHQTGSPFESSERHKIARTKNTHEPFIEFVPESPEAIEERKRKQEKIRHIFRRCFEPTFDPAMQPGCSQIFAANSDSEGDT